MPQRKCIQPDLLSATAQEVDEEAGSVMKPAESLSLTRCCECACLPESKWGAQTRPRRANGDAARRHSRSNPMHAAHAWPRSESLLLHGCCHQSCRLLALLVPRKRNFGYTEEPALAHCRVKLHTQPWNDSHNGRWKSTLGLPIRSRKVTISEVFFTENHLEARHRGARRQARFQCAEGSCASSKRAVTEETWWAERLIYGDVISKMNVHA